MVDSRDEVVRPCPAPGVSEEALTGSGDLPAAVSVVITSVDRPSLVAAVASALGQSIAPIEVIVVFDRDDDVVGVPLPQDERVKVLHTGTRGGASSARQLGAEAAQGELVAFLDDDDTWHVDKLRLQVEEHRRRSHGGHRVVVSCRADQQLPDGRSRGAAPRLPYTEDMEVGDFLFVRHYLAEGSFGLASSTLLCDTDLVREVPWSPGLRLHEDWDWVLRATRGGALLSVIPQPLAVYRLQPAGAAASRPPGGWDASAAWARSAGLSPAALGDFLLCVSAVNAAAYGDRGAAVSLALAARREGRPTLRGWLAFAIQLLVPLRVVGVVAAASRRVTQHGTVRAGSA